jgi:hypothetical protein
VTAIRLALISKCLSGEFLNHMNRL